VTSTKQNIIIRDFNEFMYKFIISGVRHTDASNYQKISCQFLCTQWQLNIKQFHANILLTNLDIISLYTLTTVIVCPMQCYAYALDRI